MSNCQVESSFVSQPVLPSTGFLRVKQVLEFIPISRSTWWAGVANGRFPKPVKLGSSTLWRAEDIRLLIAEISGEQ